MGREFLTCSFNYVPRSANEVAHVLATEALKSDSQWSMVPGIKDFANAIVQRDGDGIIDV